MHVQNVGFSATVFNNCSIFNIVNETVKKFEDIKMGKFLQSKSSSGSPRQTEQIKQRLNKRGFPKHSRALCAHAHSIR